jgi:hypothetical protein
MVKKRYRYFLGTRWRWSQKMRKNTSNQSHSFLALSAGKVSAKFFIQWGCVKGRRCHSFKKGNKKMLKGVSSPSFQHNTRCVTKQTELPKI